ncbi:MAG TPA: hypothetical protein VE988_27800 [Gemmataceae bacterium]|nr:hypothetical protein [Gemmataceae bacterium]
MLGTPVSQVQRQVAKASRRLFIQALVNRLVWCCAAGLLAATVWFLVQPLLFTAPEEWLRWAIGGGIFALATGVGIWLTIRHAPSHVEAALELDHRFQLKERATTSLTLDPALTHSAAGQALTADADAHVAKVNVRQGFPVRLRWNALVVPASAVALALVAIFYNPVFQTTEAVAAKNKQVHNIVQIAEALEKAKNPLSLNLPKQEKSPELEEIEKLNEKLFKNLIDIKDKDDIREMAQKMLTLEEKIKNRLDDLKAQEERNKAMENKLKEMGQDPAKKLNQDGPAKDFEDALNKGDLAKAQKDLQDLADKLKNDGLNDPDREKLEKQLEEIQKMLKDVAEMKDVQDQLKKDMEAGKINPEDLEKLLDALKENAEQLKNLEKLADKLGEAKDAMKGDPKDAAKMLQDAAKDLKDLDPNSKEMLLLQQQDKELMNLKMLMQNGLDGGGPPGTERPVAPDKKTGAKDAKTKADLDPNAPFKFSGKANGGQFKKIEAGKVGGAFEKAQQDAPTAIDRQQVPADAADLTKGFFENLGGAKKK